MTLFLLLAACAHDSATFGFDFEIADTSIYDLENNVFGFTLDPSTGTNALTIEFITSEMPNWSIIEFDNNDLDGNGAFNLHIFDAPDTAWIAITGTGREDGGYNHPICLGKNVGNTLYPSGDAGADIGRDDVTWVETVMQNDDFGTCHLVYSWFTEDAEPIAVPSFQ
ncbi:MAG: hypothetical protein UY72_C0064G0009 [Candidatus Uhrbacteria bacterium GW2011_GWD2_52_7]|uniref:Uncharacterized protein n=1 Tax=Candidatus Uhrbacteria bacterium GW2011_GWD2_52_7 TaxID=1618989 RepID=A0A0G1XCK5_9BACT|nr:MAG: hypothetical protein UY72_C0064G0009 [Candidatus Uhrbacteria bacterium GW2011_GWD2_52_7]